MNVHRRIAHGFDGLDTDFQKSFHLFFMPSFVNIFIFL
jgi:hypothetical protein